MVIFWTIFLTWLVCGVGFALILIRYNYWILFGGSLALFIYGGFAAIESIRNGGILNNVEFEYAGQSLLLFFSVLGSALLGIALSEMRKNKNQDI